MGGTSSTNRNDGKSERKKPLGKPRHRCEDNIGMDLREM
jgi:hypothetical protein